MIKKVKKAKTKQQKGRNRSGDKKVSNFKKNTIFYKKREPKLKEEKNKKKGKIFLDKESFFIFGRNAVNEVLQDNPKSLSKVFFIAQDKKDIQKFPFSLDILNENEIYFETTNNDFVIKNLGEVNHQGIVAIVKKFGYLNFKDWIKTYDRKNNNLVLVLDRIEDTHNFGAIIRTAASCDVKGIFVLDKNQAPVNGTVFKTSAGNINKINIIKVKNINECILSLKKSNFWVYGLGTDSESQTKKQNLFSKKFNGNTAIVLGNEGTGLTYRVMKNCDEIISIPMENGVESLNVSVSAAISMYEWKRQNN